MIDTQAIQTLRFLSIDMVEKANSGHPGLPLGAAPMAYTLWKYHLEHNPKNPNWINRDRFVLSAGHGSALLYSLLHLFGYDLTIDDLKNFRQMHSKTPGHPEYGYTVGVEATTGPLGQGIANAVGMAMAENHLAAKLNTDNETVVDHYTYALAGEGCLMEGVSGEASSLAGTLKLNKLIVLFDSNDITIDGRIDISFTEDVKMRYEAYHWHVLQVDDGDDVESISKAILEAKNEKERPTLLIIRTKIGKGSPVEDKSAAHGNPIPKVDIDNMKVQANFPNESFYVPDEVKKEMDTWVLKANEKEIAWQEVFDRYVQNNENKERWDSFFNFETSKIMEIDDLWHVPQNQATRAASGQVLNTIATYMPNLFGGSADLAGSNNTTMKNSDFFSSTNPDGNNIHFGIREHAMAAIANGIMLHGGLQAFVASFLVFSDYMKPSIRLSALMNLPVIYILTHDSIGVGEDGPTHQPIEHLAALRSIPNFTVFRPADNNETAAAWVYALTNQGPTSIILTRQNVNQLKYSSKEALKGGYVVKDAIDPAAIIIATGSEVQLAVEAANTLEEEKIMVRVVSMPSVEVFEKQSEEYREYVLPKDIKKRIVVEAASPFGWHKYAGDEGFIIGMHSFGESAPGDELFSYFNITTDEIITQIKNMLFE